MFVPVVLNRQRTTRRAASIVTAGLALTIGGNAAWGSATAVAADGMLARHSQATATPQRCDSHFHVAPTSGPVGFTSQVLGLASISTTDVWAVGITSASHYTTDPFSAHFDGTSWTQVPSSIPNPSGWSSDFRAVAAVPGAVANNVWAVGELAGAPMAEQWSGTGWHGTTLPSPPGRSELNGVVAISPTNIWAVGTSSSLVGIPASRTLIEHYDGTSWSIVASPDPSPASVDRLLGVSATSANDIWAVGDSMVGITNRTLIEHWDGVGWSIVASPNVGYGNNTLNAVATTSSSAAWAAGTSTDAAGLGETLTERWDGSSWTVIPSPTVDAGNTANYLNSLAAISPDNVWAAGFINNNTPTIGHPVFIHPLIEHWDGQGWTVVAAPDGLPPIPHSYGDTTFFSEFHAITATSASNVWAAGLYDDVRQPPPNEFPLFENLCVPAPTVTGVVPLSGNATGGIAVSITGKDFNYLTGVNFGTTPAAGFFVNSSTSITATPKAEAAGIVDVTVTNYGGASPASPNDLFLFVPPAVSWQQYRLTGSDGVTWQPIDTSALALTITPTVDSLAILTANTDLWTANAGINQDLAIFVSGGSYDPSQPVAWKESGGLNGTFSPNAAAVQAVLMQPRYGLLKAGTTYTVTLKWKANHATGGTIFAGAGPGMPFSPTRLTAELVPSSDSNLNLATSVSNGQDVLTGIIAGGWNNLLGLHTTFTPTAPGFAVLTANADLWTQDVGVNQDLGIQVIAGAFGTGRIVGWKESGGYGGTFSPDAVYLQVVIPVEAGISYEIFPLWKANHPTNGTIRAGAGPGPSNFSPSSITAHVIPAGAAIQDAVSQQQYSQTGSTGSDWLPIDSSNLTLPIATTAAAKYSLSANADLWTANAGVNQDLGIMITGGAFGSAGTLVAWKESGGFAGTFSPNAAFVQTVIPLAASTTYAVTLVWKANHYTTGTIYAGAGLGPLFSPTRLTVAAVS